mmetsp:Transcript_61585/g.133301  ORF Transcript_61585/g.133301 Transcript_61585/m.133301 type:complete len:238 (+) Transcript_61585:98-811(+)
MAPFSSTTAVLLAAPQLIGYIRGALYAAGFAVIDVPAVSALGIKLAGFQICLLCYTVAFVLDVVDGKVARILNQTSQLGGVLDMVVDRSATAALLTVLAGAYPSFRLHFAFLVSLDVGSHWMHVASCQLRPDGGHHKAADTLERRNVLLRLYYGIYPLFGYCCVCTEAFYILLLALAYAPDASFQLGSAAATVRLVDVTWYLCFPACVLKNIVNLMQLWSGTVALAELDTPLYQKRS